MVRNQMVLSLALVGLAAAGLIARGPEKPVPGGTVWVTERTVGNSTVAGLDTATGEWRGPTPVGNAPIGITAPRSLDKVYSSCEGANQLSVIDKQTMTVIATIPMGAGSKPHHLMASRNGHYIYVGEYGSNKVGVVDPARRGGRRGELQRPLRPRRLYFTERWDLTPPTRALFKNDVGTFSRST